MLVFNQLPPNMTKAFKQALSSLAALAETPYSTETHPTVG